MKQFLSKIKNPRSVSSETKSVAGNFIFLGVVQATNAIIPLLILPFLLVTLGVENFGLLAFAQSIMSYFIIITDYGFNLTSTQKIVRARHDKRLLSQIVSNTLVLKCLLALASFLVLVILIHSIPKLFRDSALYYLSFSLVIGQLLLPTWFFQGVEKMQYLAIINAIGKLIFTVMIFFLVSSPADFLYVPLYLSLGNIISGIAGIFLMYRNFGMKFILPAGRELKSELLAGSSIMFSNFAINAYVNSNIVILGIFSNSLVTGYYSIAEKILYCVRQVLNLYFQATYPRVCRLVTVSHVSLILFFKKLFVPFTILITIVCASVYTFAGQIVYLAVGGNDADLELAIKLFSFVPLIVCLNIPAYQTLLAYNFQQSAMLVLIAGSVINIVLNLVLAARFGIWGTISSVVITEVFITVGLHIILRRRHPEYKLSMQ